MLDRKLVVLDLKQDNKAVGTRFDRFGILTTWVDGNGQHIYFGYLSYTYSQK